MGKPGGVETAQGREAQRVFASIATKRLPVTPVPDLVDDAALRTDAAYNRQASCYSLGGAMKDIKATSAPPAEDPLGYDTSDPVAAVRRMAEDAVAGIIFIKLQSGSVLRIMSAPQRI
jgi:hypothetical protein